MSNENKTPDISPAAPERTDLLTLTAAQAAQVKEAMDGVQSAQNSLEACTRIVQGLLQMAMPEGSTGFDAQTMTFYSDNTPN